MQIIDIHSENRDLSHATLLRAADLPDEIDLLIEASLSPTELAQWREWLAAPRVRLLGAFRQRLRRGLLALSSHSIDPKCNSPETAQIGSFTFDKINILAISVHGVLLNDTYRGRPKKIGLPFLTRTPVDALLDQLASHCDDNALWSIINKRLHLDEPGFERVLPTADDAMWRNHIGFWTERAEGILSHALKQARLSCEDHAAALKAIRRREEALRLKAMTWFQDAFEADCLAMVAQHRGTPTCGLYNWLARAAPVHRRHRLQALQSAPFLLDALIHSCKPYAEPLNTVNRAIDQCQPLTPALSAALGLRNSEVKRLRTVSRAEFTLEALRENYDRYQTLDQFQNLLRRLQCIAPEHWPRTHADMQLAQLSVNTWYWFADTIDSFIPGASARLWLPDGAVTRHFRQLARRGWQAPAPAHSSNRAINEIQHMLRALAIAADHLIRAGAQRKPRASRWLTLPACLHGLAEWPYRKLQRLASRWHEALQQVTPRYPDPDTLQWPALLPPITLGKRRITFITSPGALEKEGQTMHHCVGECIEECLIGQSHIAHLSDLDGTPRSTLELRLAQHAQGWQAVVQEHSGQRNNAPDADCMEAVRALLQHIETPAAQTHLARLSSQHPAGTTRLAIWQNDAYDQRARRNCAAFEIALPGLLAPCQPRPKPGQKPDTAFQAKHHLAQQVDFIE